MCSHAYYIGLSSVSLDNLTSQEEKFDTKPSAPATGQTTTITIPGSQSQGDSPMHMADSAHHTTSIDTNPSTATMSCDSETSSMELNQSKTQMLSIEASHEDQMHEPMAMTSFDTSSESAYKVMIHCHDKLVTALSNDIITVSGILVANEFIPPEISNKMLLPTLTSQEKATSLVNAITKKIKLVPSRFQELIKIFSEQVCSKDIIPSLSSHISHQQVTEDGKQDVGVILSTDQQDICKRHIYTAWETLDPDDKIDLEARLLTDAETIGQDFALLCCKARDSFARRGITPQDLAHVLLDLLVYKPTSSTSIPLLQNKEETLMKAQSVHDTFNTLRPYMSFYNYELLQFLIEGKGSKDDKDALATYMRKFMEFCRRHVFEVPQSIKYSNGHHIEDHKMKQRLHIKVTKHFRTAFLLKSTTKSLSSTDDEDQIRKVCSNKLGISLEDAKNIQRKIASILNLNVSSLFLDTISDGSVILTFMLPTVVSLSSLDNNPEIAQLSSNGISILCGPPGELKLIELTRNGMILKWSQPEYGCKSLKQYTVYYRKKDEHESTKWQKFELDALDTRTCVPDLSDGDTYIFKICTVSDGGTLQYGDESDPIVLSSDGILTNNIHKVIVANRDMLKTAFSLADHNTLIVLLLIKGVISKEDEALVRLASTPNEQTALLVTAIERQIRDSPEKFQDFLNVVHMANLSLPDDIVESLQSGCYNKEILILAFSSADHDTIAAVLSIKGVISKEDEAQVSMASSSEKANFLVTAIERQIKSSPEKSQDFQRALHKINLSLPDDIVKTLWSDYYDGVYKQYLDYLYASLDNRQRSSDQWPPSVTKKFFRLAMIQSAIIVEKGKIEDRFIRMTITGKVDDILQHKYPIQLENIFDDTRGQRKVILLEGAPGCGKSTLSVYICQQWEKGQIFNQFKLVILVRLRDPVVKHAEGLADLLPCSNAKTAELLAGIMMEMKCQDVLFILDGWDELPFSLRKKSIFGELVSPYLPSSNQLCKSAVIVTSRPIASGDLHQVVSSRVEILGFTTEELNQFFIECLDGDIDAVKTLLERIEENPEVAGSSYLPLNATILVHLFKEDCNSLPTTLYGIFSNLVLTCIKRHLKLRTQYKDVSIESLDQLPEFAKMPFLVLCQLAYDGVMEEKIVFTSLPADINTLSLLQGVESFIEREKAVSYNFIHLSIQELLAAWYIATQLPASEQVSKFNVLFNKARFSSVFQFYAAITELKTPGIKDVVTTVAKQRHKSLLVSLLHCLYEAQDPSLYELVAYHLQHELSLNDTTLAPSDCLCIGYFLAHVCKMAIDEFKVDLGNCSIDNQGCKYLVSGLQKCLNAHSAISTQLHVNMIENYISHDGICHLSLLLKIGCVYNLNIGCNDIVSKRDKRSAFDTFTEQLKNNTTLKLLWLNECGLDSRSAESLAEALTTNKNIELLSICRSALYDDGIQYLAHAVQVNQSLQILWLSSCGMTDVGLECLAKSLQHNKVLNVLNVGNISGNRNRLTKRIVPVLTRCLQINDTLTKLVLPKKLEPSIQSIEKAVNDVRKRSGLPYIEVKGMSVHHHTPGLELHVATHIITHYNITSIKSN
jgi:Ran GTPase-activating protein (RanGAP) involved in mRNA processing and transport